MDSATQQMLDTVRKRRDNLNRIEQLILEEFGESQPTPNGNGPLRRKSVKTESRNGVPRKTQLHEWLKENGPSSRSDIISRSGLPEGTISGYLSAEKGLFENRDGLWHAR